MIINIEGFTTENEELIKEAYRIRDIVFVKEQGVDKYLEYDGFDKEATHYLVYYNEIPAATARWRETEEGIKLERFAVLKEYRGKALASILLKMILEEVKMSKKKIYLHAQDSAVSFYENHKFEIIGEKFKEADIDHYKMVYKNKTD